MATTNQTLRVRNIPWGTTREQFETELRDLVTEPRKRWLPSLSSSLVSPILMTSLASHVEGASMDGTVTFLDKDQKDRALRANHTGWEFDDKFDGVTVLHSPSSAEVDICAVHGMNGNAFETWAKGNDMWLRDLLPTSEHKNTRIMTFGYNSQLLDRKTEMGIKQWGMFLLQQVSSVRKGLEGRPLIFIGYSLGGLVVREAMVRLNEHPAETPNMILQRCGQLFLGTPHSGTTEADWNDFIVNCSDILFGLRREAIINNFRSFNTNSVDNKERFNMIEPRLSFRCLCETKMMKAKGKNRLVVSSDSAGLLGVTATPMYNVDHRMMCKFGSSHDPNFNLVVNELALVQQNIKNDVSSKIKTSEKNILPKYQVRSISEPPQNAPFYPLGTCYEGLPIPFQEEPQLVGRDEEISAIEGYLKDQKTLGAVTVAITGMGGIGKTELLHEIARLNHGQKRIFYFPATDQGMLGEAYEEMALRIGPEVLAERSIAPRDFVRDWQVMEPHQRTHEFRIWLEGERNQNSLIILDDLDGLGNAESIREAFPRNSRLVLYSSRNPHLGRLGPRAQPRVQLSPLSEVEVIGIIKSECVAHGDQEFGDLNDPQILHLIADRIQGHPLIASQAVKYMREVLSLRSKFPGRNFLEICDSHDRARLKSFLRYEPSGGRSILETFQTSKYRLERKGKNNAWNLMLLISHLQANSSIVDFRDFFFSRSNVKDLPQLEGDDISNLNEEEEVLTALSELEKVSFYTRQGTTSALEFHSFWLECGRQMTSKERREDYLRYILVTCFRCITHAQQNQDKQLENSFFPHVYHYFDISKSFDASLQALNLPTLIAAWIRQLRDTTSFEATSSNQLLSDGGKFGA